jgi:CheY-like chemotaxis protein
MKSQQLAETIGRLLMGVAAAPIRLPVTEVGPMFSQGRPLRILVAEDNLVNQKVAIRLLERLGYRPNVVSNGLEAVEAVRRQDYDLVLMDIQMPEMDGLEAARCIVSSGRHPHLIALTANVLNDDREECLEAGMDDFLEKPLDLDTLRRALERCVGEREPQANTPAPTI